jgi:hypothetical protein
MEDIWRSPDASACGVSLVSCVKLNLADPRPFWADLVYGFRQLSSAELADVGRHSGSYKYSERSNI